jgi:hypothetical protein
MNLHGPHDYDIYAEPLFTMAEELEVQAKTVEDAGDHTLASRLYL